MADMNNVKVKIFAYLHAASYVEEDAFEIAKDYQRFTEIGWVASCDKVFVATEHHKKIFTDRRLSLVPEQDRQRYQDKIVVTGNPVFTNAYKHTNAIKKNKILLTNRFDYEKRPNETLEIFKTLKEKHPSWEFVVTSGHKKLKSNKQWLLDKAYEYQDQGIITIKDNLTKDQYHKELEEAKVVVSNNTVQETFGICVIEALVYNAAAVCPNCLSHPEIVPEGMLFDTKEQQIKAIENYMENPVDCKPYVDKYEQSVVLTKMINEMKE